MPKAAYTGVSGVAKKNTKIYVGVEGVAKSVKSGYVGVEGVAKQFWASGPTVGELDIGTSVYMNVSGVRKEFIVVHQGLPSDIYDASCNGTWLLMKNIHTKKVGGSPHYYQNSAIHTYLNNTFYPLFDADIKPLIKEAKIPYYSAKNTVSSGANGLATKVFILSAKEIGAKSATWSGGYTVQNDGARLEYFPEVHTNTNQSHLIAQYNGTNTEWVTRSPVNPNDTAGIAYVNMRGNLSSYAITQSLGVRPALILYSDTGYNETTFDIIA